MAEYVDMEIICVDCKKPFVFEAGEQQFFAEKKFTPPKRCKPCRDQRKAQKETRPDRTPAASEYTAPEVRPEYADVWSSDSNERRPRARKRSKGGRSRDDH